MESIDWITKVNNKQIANAGQSKQHKITLANIRIKLKTNPVSKLSNNLQRGINSLRGNPEPSNDDEFKIIITCVLYDDNYWRYNTSRKINQIPNQSYHKSKNHNSNLDIIRENRGKR